MVYSMQQYRTTLEQSMHNECPLHAAFAELPLFQVFGCREGKGGWGGWGGWGGEIKYVFCSSKSVTDPPQQGVATATNKSSLERIEQAD